MRGILITIEGIDGSGKGTQSAMLFEKLKINGFSAKLYSFPCYEETFFGKEIGAFLRGDFGSLEDVHPKLASILFAGDRFEKKNQILDDLNNGVNIICDRYVDSNIAHQCAKVAIKDRADLSCWIEELEYKVFGLPKPDITYFLDVPLSISKSLVLKKKKRSYTEEKEDIHESSYDYLSEVYSMYSDLEKIRNWKKVRCTGNLGIRDIEKINTDIYLSVFNKIRALGDE